FISSPLGGFLSSVLWRCCEGIGMIESFRGLSPIGILMLTPQKLTVKTLLSALCGLAAFFSGATAQDLYWTVNGPRMTRASLDGAGAEIVFDATGRSGTAVDVAATADYMYWPDKSDSNPNGGVWRAKRNGDEAALFIANPDPETMTSFA